MAAKKKLILTFVAEQERERIAGSNAVNGERLQVLVLLVNKVQSGITKVEQVLSVEVGQIDQLKALAASHTESVSQKVKRVRLARNVKVLKYPRRNTRVSVENKRTKKEKQ